MSDIQGESAQALRQRAEEELSAVGGITSLSLSREETDRLLHELQVHQIELTMQKEDLLHTQHDLELSKARYFTLYDLAPVAYLTLTTTGLIKEANLTAATLFGIPLRNLLKKPLTNFILADDQNTFYLHRKRVLEMKETQGCELRMLRADGSQFWAYKQATSSHECEYLVTLTDITRLKQTEADLVSAKSAAEAANIAKSRFLATMSHEIRTPMNGVLGGIQMLEMSGLTQEQREYAAIAKKTGLQLMHLINEILELSKIEADKVILENIEFDLRQLLADTVNSLSFQAREKGLILSTSIESDVPTLVRGDAGRLRQVLINLVSNAIKFTPAGSVELCIHTETETAKSATLCILVRDSGIGIAAHNLEHIFEPFVQADSSTTRTYGGTGLGLSICKHFVELMGGFIGVKSNEGQGSTFYFTVPLDKQSAEVPHAESATCTPALPRKNVSTHASPTAASQNSRILLAEDEPIAQKMVSKLLQHFGYQVDVAENGRDILAALEQRDYNIVLMDCMMPLMNGYETTATIRNPASAVRNHTIPVIALTANAYREDREKCLAAGMNDFLTKPLDIQELLAMLVKWS